MGRIIETQLKLPKWMELAIVLASCAQAQAAPKWPLLGVSRAAAHEASSLAQPPAGFVYQPVDPNYYKQVAEQARERFRVNATFFQNINSTKVPAISRVTNGTFDVLPVSSNSTPRAEDAWDGYDYNSLLGMSWLFYEAQRSGKLPPHNRIPWRNDSALDDVAPNRISSVSGGWYDAGDHLKLHFPMCFAASNLAWGFIEFQDGYSLSGQTPFALDNFRWIGDYIMKLHYSNTEFCAQVGDMDADHSVWGRAEDMKMPRPSYSVSPTNPGSDLLGQCSAALAAISIIFERMDPLYALQLESHARDLYALGSQHEGRYSDSVPAASKMYPSSYYEDDLAWGASWLYRKTGDAHFLQDAQTWYNRNKARQGGGGYLGYGWDSSIWGVNLQLAYLTNNSAPVWAAEVQRFLDAWIYGYTGVIQYTPLGLAWSNAWGSLRFTANAALIAVVYAKHIKESDPRQAQKYECWARSQIRYMIGDSGRSYVVGFGSTPPSSEHHRGASCQLESSTGSDNPVCDWKDFALSTPNPNTLYGALVGGPSANDAYKDVRDDYQRNEVAVDYNACFTGVVAALAGSSDTYTDCMARGDIVHPIG